MAQPFIDAFKDLSNNQAQNFVLADIRGDGHSYLVFFQAKNSMLVVYKQIRRQFELRCNFKGINSMLSIRQPTSDSIGVCSGQFMYVYRNMCQSFRLKVPDVKLPVSEKQLYDLSYQQCLKGLQQLRKQSISLSEFSKKMFLSSDQIKKELFANAKSIKDTIISAAFVKGTVILGTQNKKAYFLNKSNTDIIKQIELHVIPQFIKGNQSIYFFGRFCDYQINAQVHSLPAFVVDVSLSQNQMHVALNNCTFIALQSSNVVYKAKVPGEISLLAYLKTSSLQGLLVCYSKNIIGIYNKDILIASVVVKDEVKSMSFGSYGREEGCLFLAFVKFGFQIKILNRKFNFSKNKRETSRMELKGINSIPTPNMFSLKYFQAQRLNSKTYYQDSQIQTLSLISHLLKQTIKSQALVKNGLIINVQLLGIDPFLLKVNVNNTSDSGQSNVKIVLSYQTTIFLIERPLRSIQFIPKNGQFHEFFKLKRQSRSIGGQIKIIGINGKDETNSLTVSIAGQMS